jgi:DNA repair exonuclease SbcCD ATPase subunit
MGLNEILREQTEEIRDALAEIETRRKELLGRRGALEYQSKRGNDERSRARAVAEKQTQIASKLEREEADLAASLEEIERERTTLQNRLAELRATKENVTTLLNDAKRKVQDSTSSAGVLETSRIEVSQRLQLMAEERARLRFRLRDIVPRAFERHLGELARRVEKALSERERRGQHRAASDAARAAREADPGVADLWHQREQLQGLIATAAVPAVRASLEASLESVETEIRARFPHALDGPETSDDTTTVEELHHLIDGDRRFSLFVPVTREVWDAIEAGDAGSASSHAMRLLWSIVTATRPVSTGGHFHQTDLGCVYSGRLPTGTATLPAEIPLDLEEPGGLTFRLTSIPTDIQEIVRSAMSTS